MMLLELKIEQEVIVGILAIVCNIFVFFGVFNNIFGFLYNMEYCIVIDLMNCCYFFELIISFNVIWVNFD